jgi:beta-glucanase (GH16 family)
MRPTHLVFMAYFVFTVAAAVMAPEHISQGKDKSHPQTPSGFKLVWADEFEKDGVPDSRNWNYETGFVRNMENQWYQPDNATCKNGLLIIEGKRERKQNPHFKSDSKDWRENWQYAEYTSTSLTTRGLHAWKYGRFEMRGRIDTRPGLWPAFWTLGTGDRWPGCGEIDIMEYYQGTLLANAAWASEKPEVAQWDDIRKPLTDFNDPEWSSKFHVWRMDWDADSIQLYVDDFLMNRIDLKETFNKDSERKNPFRQSHYIIMNLAIGGTSGGDPSKTEFPARFEIDYVRVFQKQ